VVAVAIKAMVANTHERETNRFFIGNLLYGFKPTERVT